MKTTTITRAGAPLGANEGRANQRSVNDLVWRIEDFKSASLGGTLSLVGPWGSGKSSLAIAAASRLRTEHGWQTATFEPWAYGDYVSTIEGFFGVLRQQLGTKSLNRSARKILSKFFASVAPLGGIGNAFGVPLKDAFLGIAKVAAKNDDFIVMRQKANRLFSKAEKPILIIIEDLDRLDAQELMTCFKLIRLLGELDNVYYLLCYDEQTIVDVMQKTDIIGQDGVSRAYEYLEKIVQIRVEVLDLYGSEQESLWEVELERIINLYEIRTSEHDLALLKAMWQDSFKQYLNTPRSLKRFALHLKSAWQSIAGEVNFADFVGVNFLRFFENAVFRKIKNSRALLLDELKDNSKEERITSAERKDLMKVWLQEVADLKPRHLDAVNSLLGDLFFAAKDSTSFESYTRFFRNRRIDGVLYFDRYFRNSISIDDIPERAYQAYVWDTIQGEFCELSDRVREELNLRNPLVWERIESEVAPTSREAVGLYQSMRTQYGHLMGVGGIVTPQDGHVLRYAFKTFSYRGNEQHTAEWYEQQSDTLGGLAIGTDIYLDAWETKHLGTEDRLSPFDQAMQDLAKEAIKKLLDGPAEGADHSVLRVIKVLESTMEPGDMQAFLQHTIEESKEWTVFDVLVGLLEVEIEHTATGPTFKTNHTKISKMSIGRYFDLEWVESKLLPSTNEKTKEVSWSDDRPDQALLRATAMEATRVAIRVK